ncbi:MAG: DUF4132 domain-containing protein [Deltaproteobacteria bacterium]|nr:DUF4132 domain-containing protein [Deltaproteobacteria bacterium]
MHAMLDTGPLETMRSPLRGKTKKKALSIAPDTIAKALRTRLDATRATFVGGTTALAAVLGKALPKPSTTSERAIRQSAAMAFVDGLDAATLTSARDAPLVADVCRLCGLTQWSFDARKVEPEIFVALWLAHGHAFALEAALLSLYAYTTDLGWSTGGEESLVPPTDVTVSSAFECLELLRTQLAIAPATAWTEAHDRAASLRGAHGVLGDCVLAYLFPEERGWSGEAARGWLVHRAKDTPTGFYGASIGGYALLGSVSDPKLAESILAHAIAKGSIELLGRFAADAALTHGEAVLGALATIFLRTNEPKETWSFARSSLLDIAKVIACFDDRRATDLLLEKLDHKIFGPIANEHLERFPAVAVRVLAPSLADKSKTAGRRVALLDAIVRGHGEVARAALDDLDPSTARLLAKRLPPAGEVATTATSTRATSPSGEASRDRWPPVLASPPWRQKGERPRMPTVAGLSVPTRAPRVVLDPATKAKWLEHAERVYYPVQPAMIATNVENARKNVGRTSKVTFFDGHYATIPLNAGDDVLETMWALPPFSSTFEATTAEHVLARLGARAVPGLLARLAVEPTVISAAAFVDSPEVSIHLARCLKKPSLRSIAYRALARFPETHAVGLVTFALGEDPKDAPAARAALRWLADNDRRAAVLEGASAHGTEARAAIEAMLAIDPLDLCPAKPPRLSDYADPALLPPLRLREGGTLPAEATRNFLEMLQFTPIDPPYAGIEAALAGLDRASVDALVWALVEAWVRAGGSPASAWALQSIAHAGSDSLVKSLAAEIRRWPREKAKSRALLGLEVLARMGTDVALLFLDDLSKKARNKDVEARAKELLTEVAEVRGLSALELEDRLVPTLDLDEHGARSFAIGARTITVRFDEQLAPYLLDAAGKRLDKIHKDKSDEPEALKAAQDAWKELKADAAQVAKALTSRLDRAMCEERRWDHPTFRGLFVKHPFSQHLGRRVVWGVFAEESSTPSATFRVAEDGSYADANDDAITIAADASIGIVHPLHLEAALLAAWGQRLGEYEIVQPIEQLARRVERIDPARAEEAPFTSVHGKTVSFGALVGVLEARGWRMESPDGDGLMSDLSRRFGDQLAYVGFAPGFRPREPRPSEVSISVAIQRVKKLGKVPALAYSEIMRDLATLNLV